MPTVDSTSLSPSLPAELWRRIAIFVALSDIINFRSTCKFINNAVDPLSCYQLQVVTPDRYDLYYSRALKSGNYNVAFFFALKLNRYDDLVDLCLADAPLGDHSHNSASPLCISPSLPSSPAASPRSSFSLKAPLPAPAISSVSVLQALNAVRLYPDFAGTAAAHVVLQGLSNKLDPALGSITDILDHLLRTYSADLDAHSGLALRLAALHGDLDLATYLLSHGANPTHRDARALTWSTAHGHLHLLTPLLDALRSTNPCSPLDNLWPPAVRAKAYVNAAGSNHLHVLKWFAVHLPALQPKTLASALHQSSLHGHPAVTSYLLDTFPHLAGSFPPTVLESVVEKGHLHVLQTLASRRVRIDPNALLYPAALKGRLDILDYLSTAFRVDLSNPRTASKTLSAALRNPDPSTALPVLSFLRDHHDAKLSSFDLDMSHSAAIRDSNAFALRWIHDHAEEVVRDGLAGVLDEDALCEAVADAAGQGWAEGVGILVGAGMRLVREWAAKEEAVTPPSTPPSGGGMWWGEMAGSAGSAKGQQQQSKGRKGFRGVLRQLRSQGWILEVVA